jgi:hypothetical protein
MHIELINIEKDTSTVNRIQNKQISLTKEKNNHKEAGLTEIKAIADKI